ncbi:MAG TPA: tRNA pseudouridine(55) synthase TruB [Steroidobacteraceae bacterium]|nr:tRNA pseudouridine(55) synthase TruB [Steroidobacteraceae bacterium]
MTSGILLLDKPAGLSSNAALQRVRRLFGAPKAGHVGSLDPLATGMLPVCLGEATKVAGELVGGRKRYRFAVALGAATDTGDREGAVIETAPVPACDAQTLQVTLARFTGRQQQVPPMYSALKHQGRPLYRLARAGIEIERAAREIEISELTLRGCEGDVLDLEALCSKGTYVRALAQDIARALGTCGHVVRLRRLYVEPFDDEPMHSLDALASLAATAGEPLAALIAADRALARLPSVTLSQAAAARLGCGQTVAEPQCRWAGRVRLYDDRGRFMGLGDADGAGAVRPRRLFAL